MGIFNFFKKVKKPKEPFVPFEIAETKKGNYDEFNKKLVKSSLILLIVGKRGSRKCYTLGYENVKLPRWIKKVDVLEKIPNNSIALIDEGAVTFFSREAMKNPNKALSKLMAIARHKNLTLILITQSSALIDLNVLRLADTLLLKEPSLLQAKFERKAIKEMYEKVSPLFKDKENKKQYAYIFDDEFEGLIKFNLPYFWNEGISKSFKNF